MRRRRIWMACAGCGLALCLTGAGMYAHDLAGTTAYQQLAQATVSDRPAARDGQATSRDATSRDWEALRATNDDVAGWIRVAGTAIDYPVVVPSDADMTWYLSHDLWGAESQVGCPFMDARSALSPHTLIFGHHLTTFDAMFTQLAHAYEQDTFDTIGPLTFEQPGQPTRTLRPLCSLCVEETDMRPQRFSFDSVDELHEWLGLMRHLSGAESSRADLLEGGATRVVTLCTCSSDLGGQPWRTLTLFVD